MAIFAETARNAVSTRNMYRLNVKMSIDINYQLSIINSICRVVFEDSLAQILDVNVGVYFGGSDVLMTK